MIKIKITNSLEYKQNRLIRVGKYFLLNHLLILFIFMSCSNRKSDNSSAIIISQIKAKFSDIFPEFYNSSKRFEFEYKLNYILPDPNKLHSIIISDSSNLSMLKNRDKIGFADSLLTETSIKMSQLHWEGNREIFFSFYKNIDLILDNRHSLCLIEYPLEKYARVKVQIISFQLDLFSSNYVSAIIQWSNEPMNYQQDIKFAPIYIWGINQTTDTIRSNLQLNTIKSLFPEFKGTYIFKKFKEVIIDDNYLNKGDDFFNHIQIIESH
ncbi:MAG: hypothetical protein NT007_07905 [Candidatus Kapabacteria bacterium]|nr:hypothetical protein [Candidatus Kapabacteria bacterium]